MVLALCGDVLLGFGSPNYDISGQFAPWFILLGDHVRQGELLLWDPWTECGMPLGLEPQTGALSPLVCVLAGLTPPSIAGFAVYWLGVWIAAGLGVLRLARYLGAPAWGGWIAALGLCFGSLFVGQGSLLPFSIATAALPWMLWRLDVALSTRRLLPAAEAGAIWGLAGMSGYPPMFMLTAGFAAWWTLAHVLLGSPRTAAAGGGEPESREPERREPEKPVRGVFHAVAALALLAAVGLGMLGPLYQALRIESVGYSNRSAELPREVAVRDNALEVPSLGSAASPALPLLWESHPWQGRRIEPTVAGMYMSGLCFWLAGLAFVGSRQRRRWAVAIGVLMLLGLGLSLGRDLPLRGWLYDLLPPTRYFRHASMFRTFWLFGLALLAIWGSAQLESQRREEPRRLQLLWPAVLATAMLALLAVSLYPVEAAGSDWVKVWGHAAIAWLGPTVVAVLMLRPARRRQAMPAAVVLAVVDAALAFSLARPLIHDGLPGAAASWRAIEAAHDPHLDLTRTRLGTARIDRLPPELGVGTINNKHVVIKQPVLMGYSTLGYAYYTAWFGQPVLREAISRQDRMWFSRDRVRLPLHSEALGAYAQRARELGAPPMAWHSRADMLSPGSEPVTKADLDALWALEPSTPLMPAWEVYRPNHMRFAVTCPDAGYLAVTDRWARGWETRVNGAVVKTQGAMFLWRGVPVTAGENIIEMRYRPAGVGLTLGLGWGVLGVVIVLSIGRWMRWRRRVGDGAGALNREEG